MSHIYMNENNLISVDGIKWYLTSLSGVRYVTPLCPSHNMRLTPIKHLVRLYNRSRDSIDDEAEKLNCAEGHVLDLPRPYGKEKQYVIDRIDAKVFSTMKVLNLDDEAIPIAKTKLKVDDISNPYFLTSNLMRTKRGLQVVIYAGKKGSEEKVQIFVDPKIRKLTFDHDDLHPTDIFLEVKGTFIDGSSSVISKP